MIDMRDVYWLAGLLEGEGYFGLRRGKDLTVEITMTDEDVIARVHVIAGFGTRNQRPLPSGKTAYGWSVVNQHQAAGLIMTILSLMGERRAARIMDCLVAWKSKPLPKIMWTHCKNGHELSGANLLIVREGKYLKRRCVRCGVLRQKLYKRRRLERNGQSKLL